VKNLIQNPVEPLLHCHSAQAAASIRACYMELSKPLQSWPHSGVAAHLGFSQGTWRWSF